MESFPDHDILQGTATDALGRGPPRSGSGSTGGGADLLDRETLQDLMDHFFRLVGLGMAIVDLEGNVLVHTGWQDVCTAFHRVHPETCRHCVESDVRLSADVKEGEYALYKCKNSMWDIATPIVVDGQHIANLFFGQFFFDDEVPDTALFEQQAEMYGFDREAYLAALSRVPRVSRQRVRDLMSFYVRIAALAARLTHGQLAARVAEHERLRADEERRHREALERTIADRERAEQALRESEERFRHLADAMPQLVWTASPQGSIDYYNARREEFPGLRANAGGTWEWTGVVHPDDLLATVVAWRRANESGSNYEIEHRLRRADGQFYWHVTRAAPVRDGSGRIVKWYGTATDIDALKRVENACLEADRRKSEFLAMLAHELRNPLAAVRNATEVIRLRLARGQDVEAPIAVLERQVRNSSRLLEDLLDVARLARGTIRLRKERVELQAVIASAVESQRALIDGAGHRLSIEMPPEPVALDADPTRLEQVVANLLNNAAKYTPEHGSIALVVERGERDVIIRVSDDGLGISAELLPRVFDLFVQADRSLNRAQGGLGLGLALVRSLIAMHGGSVEARSQGPGKGSEFVVRLPVLPSATSPAVAPARPEDVTPRRILLVEDNVDAAEMLCEVLKAQGHAVEVVHDGLSAIPAADRFEPELVLLDIGLPGMDGYEVARRLRAGSPEKAPVLVGMSGYGQESDLERSRSAGISVHLTKPFGLEQLDRVIQELIVALPRPRAADA